MPEAFKQLQSVLLRKSGGDAVMAKVLAAVPIHGLDAVLVGVGLVGQEPAVALLGQSFLSKFEVVLSGDRMTLRGK